MATATITSLTAAGALAGTEAVECVQSGSKKTTAQAIANLAPVSTVAGRTGAVTLTSADVSGGAALASPTFTGTPAAPTAAAGTSTTQLATTAFVAGVAPVTRRLTADVTNATTTLANLTDLSITLAAAGTYVGKLIIKCNNSAAAEGVKLDFGGGSATATAFWAAASELVGGTTVIGTAIATSLTGAINFTTITGETILEVNFSIVVNAGGTFIPRAAENSHAVGTLTVELGSFLMALPSGN